jgi:hypothetical protein
MLYRRHDAASSKPQHEASLSFRTSTTTSVTAAASPESLHLKTNLFDGMVRDEPVSEYRRQDASDAYIANDVPRLAL